MPSTLEDRDGADRPTVRAEGGARFETWSPSDAVGSPLDFEGQG